MKIAGKTDDALSYLRQGRGRIIARLLTAFAAMAALAYIVYIFDVPNPDVILMTGLTLFTTLYGFSAGIVSSAVMLAYSMFFLSENHDWVTFTPVSLQKLSVIVLGAIASTLLIGNLKRRQTNAAHRLTEVNRYPRTDDLSLEEASLIDALTEVRNRFGLRRDYSRFENRHVHAMMLDLDDFKRINDTYGHAVGDYILKKAGRLLIEAFGADNCYRYGGDEFLVICADMDKAVFADRLNTLKQGMSGVYLNDKHLPVRFSVGYVYGNCERSDDLRLMMHQADGNLYQAKQMDRDRCVGGPFSRNEAESAEHSAQSKARHARDFNDLFSV